MARTSTVTTQTTISSTWANALITDYVSQTDTSDQDLASDLEIVSGKELRTNTISETSSATGVTVDGCLVKDGAVALASGIAGKVINTDDRADDTILVFSASEDEYLHEGFPISGIADQVWDEAAADHVAAGSLGKAISDLPTTVTVEGTYAHTNGTTENDALVITLTNITKVDALLFDLVNLTKTSTVRVYIKVDGTNYRLAEPYLWTISDPDALVINLPKHNHDMKVTLQSDVAEGASRNIPYSYVKEAKE